MSWAKSTNVPVEIRELIYQIAALPLGAPKALVQGVTNRYSEKIQSSTYVATYLASGDAQAAEANKYIVALKNLSDTREALLQAKAFAIGEEMQDGLDPVAAYFFGNGSEEKVVSESVSQFLKDFVLSPILIKRWDKDKKPPGLALRAEFEKLPEGKAAIAENDALAIQRTIREGKIAQLIELSESNCSESLESSLCLSVSEGRRILDAQNTSAVLTIMATFHPEDSFTSCERILGIKGHCKKYVVRAAYTDYLTQFAGSGVEL